MDRPAPSPGMAAPAPAPSGRPRRATPAGFLYGTAISGHQSEGGNVNSDCWLAENVTPTIFKEPSLDACDSYNRWGEDIAIAGGLGFNSYRFGIEWARIEPEPGVFSNAALDHYSRRLDACLEQGLAPMISFNHFTTPRWFAARGGFEVADGADLFARFAERSAARLGDRMAAASTFNEPNVQRLIALLMGGDRSATTAMLEACARACGSERFSSQIFVPAEATEATLVDAHRKAMAAIRAGPGDVQVGMTLTMQHVEGVGEGHLGPALEDALYGPWLEEAKACDFVGVQTYTRVLIGPEGRLPPPEGAEFTDAGYEFRPQALGGVIRFAAERIGRPIIVTESGIATKDDTRRVAFIEGALEEVRNCLDEGLDVRGYIYWSLLDNFEWTSGYGHQFGLVDVDLKTFRRTPKPSAYHLGALARAGLI